MAELGCWKAELHDVAEGQHLVGEVLLVAPLNCSNVEQGERCPVEHLGEPGL